jgi:hypothetical protein
LVKEKSIDVLRKCFEFNKLVHGKIMDVETTVGLTAGQAYKIAEYAARNEYYSLGLEWLKSTEVLIKEQNDTSVSGFSLANTYKRLIEKVRFYLECYRRISQNKCYPTSLFSTTETLKRIDTMVTSTCLTTDFL